MKTHTAAKFTAFWLFQGLSLDLIFARKWAKNLLSAIQRAQIVTLRAESYTECDISVSICSSKTLVHNAITRHQLDRTCSDEREVVVLEKPPLEKTRLPLFHTLQHFHVRRYYLLCFLWVLM